MNLSCKKEVTKTEADAIETPEQIEPEEQFEDDYQDREEVVENERTKKQSDGLTLLIGTFVYHDGAAIIRTHAKIYGVYINDKLKELNKAAEKYKKAPTDMVVVEIRGKIRNDSNDDTILWENKIEIKEILTVKPLLGEDDIIVKDQT